MKKLNKISSKVAGPVEKALRVYLDSKIKFIKKKEVFEEDFGLYKAIQVLENEAKAQMDVSTEAARVLNPKGQDKKTWLRR